MCTIKPWNITLRPGGKKKSVGYHFTAAKLTEWKKEPEKALFYFRSLLLSEQVADAHFINEAIARLCRPEPDAEVDYDVFTEFQVASGKNLMDLLVRRQKVAQRPDRAVILETQNPARRFNS